MHHPDLAAGTNHRVFYIGHWRLEFMFIGYVFIVELVCSMFWLITMKKNLPENRLLASNAQHPMPNTRYPTSDIRHSKFMFIGYVYGVWLIWFRFGLLNVKNILPETRQSIPATQRKTRYPTSKIWHPTLQIHVHSVCFHWLITHIHILARHYEKKNTRNPTPDTWA